MHLIKWLRIVMLILIVSMTCLSCSSRYQKLVYEIRGSDQSIENIKREIITLDGILLFSLVPDSGRVVVGYDRYKCSEEAIEKCLKTSAKDIEIRLLNKEILYIDQVNP